jgi:D-tyrosyl-tRNA(Tyr) deacylase
VIALLQRVTQAQVQVDGRTVAAIHAGALVLVCAEAADGPAQVGKLVDKLLALRVFADAAGKMNRSLRDTGGGLLLVPQFTLAATTHGGNRPGFSAAAPPVLGRQLFDAVLALARQRHAPVEAGVFGAHMQVHLVNDGPVTIPLTVR